MGWETMKDLMTEEYCPRGEIQKLEQELWNLSMKGTNVVAYTARFSELVALCPNMVPTEGKKIERYIWGLVPPYQGNVLAGLDAKTFPWYGGISPHTYRSIFFPSVGTMLGHRATSSLKRAV